MESTAMTDQGKLIFYQSDDGRITVDVRLRDETVWLTLNQMAELFGRDKSVISRHLRNIFQSGELDRESTVAKNATVQKEGNRTVTREIEWFNLDAIISVGYRVNSIRGTRFRIWATSVLKDHLVKGYTLNQQRPAKKGAAGVRQIFALLNNTLKGWFSISSSRIIRLPTATSGSARFSSWFFCGTTAWTRIVCRTAAAWWP